MATYTLADLPVAPLGKTGWPWTEAPPPLPPQRPDGLAWPRVTVVTPSFNQAQFLEETLRSVLLQGYPNLEYFVMDGGSIDNSAEIINHYAPWLSGFVIERDRGQADAINNGFARASGDILAWLNSDDIYLAGALAAQVEYLLKSPDVEVVYGDCLYTDSDGHPVHQAYGRPFEPLELMRFTMIYQPTVFMRRSVAKARIELDLSYHIALDAELWLRLHQSGARFAYQPTLVATYRLHSASKTVSGIYKMHADCERLIAAYAPPEREVRARLLADLHLQTAMQLAENREFGPAWQYARRAAAQQLTPRLGMYLALVVEKATGLPIYSRLLKSWVKFKRLGRQT